MELSDLLSDFHYFEGDLRQKAQDKVHKHNKGREKPNSSSENNAKETTIPEITLRFSNTFVKSLATRFHDTKRKTAVEKELEFVTPLLLQHKGYSLPSKYKFHYFTDNKEMGDIHLFFDVVLIFRYDFVDNILTYQDIGSHSETKLF